MNRRRWGAAFAAFVAGCVVTVVTLAAVDTRRDGSSDPEPQAAPTDAVDLAVVGDSFAEQSREELLALGEEAELDITVDAWGGSALCGWMWQIGRIRDNPPERLVLSFAGNIFHDCINPSCAVACQDVDPVVAATRYGEHLELVYSLFDGTGTQIAVVLPPPIGNADYEARAASLREMYFAVQRKHPDIVVIDSATELDPERTGFHALLPCVPDLDQCAEGEQVVVREPDNIHLTDAGAKRYALAIFESLGIR